MILNGGSSINVSANQYVGVTYNLTNVKTLGAIVTWNIERWVVVNISSNIYTLGKATIDETTQFGTNNTYKGSYLEQKCAQYDGAIFKDSKAFAIDTTVLGTTHKYFIPEYTCFSKSGSDTGTYQWYTTNERRICSNQIYWTSSAYSGSSIAWSVYTDGYVNGDYNVAFSNGFRPHVRVQL